MAYLSFFLFYGLFMDDSSCTDTPFFRPDALWREKYRKLPGGLPEKGLPPFDLANSVWGLILLGAGYRWRLNRPDTGWFFDLSLSARIWPLQLWIPLSFFERAYDVCGAENP